MLGIKPLVPAGALSRRRNLRAGANKQLQRRALCCYCSWGPGRCCQTAAPHRARRSPCSRVTVAAAFFRVCTERRGGTRSATKCCHPWTSSVRILNFVLKDHTLRHWAPKG